ncbi:MAG: hypothetical protein WCK01_03065 [Candidatus Uhrbacteria bacterium]
MNSLALIIAFSLTFLFIVGVYIWKFFVGASYIRTAYLVSKQATEEGKTPEQITEELKNSLTAKASALENYLFNKILSRISPLFVLGFLAFFFYNWMHTVSSALPATFIVLVYGFLAGVGTMICLRSLAMIFAPITDPIWIDVVADPDSTWGTLEKRLLIGAFAIVFISTVASVALTSNTNTTIPTF